MMMHYWKLNALIAGEFHIFCVWTFFSIVHTQYVCPAESPVVCIAAYLLTSPGICAAPHFHAPCDEHFPGPGPGVTTHYH